MDDVPNLRRLAEEARHAAGGLERLLADLHRTTDERDRYLAICEARQLTAEERGALEWLRLELVRDARVWKGQERAGRIEAALAAVTRVMG